MALTITIDKYHTDPDDNTKKLVGLKVKDENNRVFIVDKKVTVADGKSDESYAKDAYDASLTEINEWKAQFNVMGKTFNPSSNKLS